MSSIHNRSTGRHEDDIWARAYTAHGTVTLRELLEHIEETVVAVPEAFGRNCCTPVGALTDLVRQWSIDGDIDLDTEHVHIGK